MIDFGKVGKVISDIEKVWQNYELNITEQKLILDILQERHTKKVQDLRASDMVNNMPLGGIFGRVMKSTGGGKNESD